MGSVNDSMHSYVLRDLKNMFSPSEGWQIERAPLCGDYQVSRKRFGTTKRYPVNVVILRLLMQKLSLLKQKV